MVQTLNFKKPIQSESAPASGLSMVSLELSNPTFVTGPAGAAALVTRQFNFQGTWNPRTLISGDSSSAVSVAVGQPGAQCIFAMPRDSSFVSIWATLGPDYGDLAINVDPPPPGFGSMPYVVSRYNDVNIVRLPLFFVPLDPGVQYTIMAGPADGSTKPVGLYNVDNYNYFS